jgi:hypothetical protein
VPAITQVPAPRWIGSAGADASGLAVLAMSKLEDGLAKAGIATATPASFRLPRAGMLRAAGRRGACGRS